MAEQKNTVDAVKESSTRKEKSSNQERSPRALDSRDATQRISSWENPTNLPDPTPQEGWEFRYIRTSILGQVDNGLQSLPYRGNQGHLLRGSAYGLYETGRFFDF